MTAIDTVWENESVVLFVALALELGIPTSSARESVKMLSHKCPLLTSWTCSLQGSYFACLRVYFVEFVPHL